MGRWWWPFRQAHRALPLASEGSGIWGSRVIECISLVESGFKNLGRFVRVEGALQAIHLRLPPSEAETMPRWGLRHPELVSQLAHGHERLKQAGQFPQHGPTPARSRISVVPGGGGGGLRLALHLNRTAPSSGRFLFARDFAGDRLGSRRGRPGRRRWLCPCDKPGWCSGDGQTRERKLERQRISTLSKGSQSLSSRHGGRCLPVSWKAAKEGARLMDAEVFNVQLWPEGT